MKTTDIELIHEAGLFNDGTDQTPIVGATRDWEWLAERTSARARERIDLLPGIMSSDAGQSFSIHTWRRDWVA